MTRRRLFRPLALMAAIALFFAVSSPRPAPAETLTTVAVVSSGVVAGVLIIAIIGSSLTHDEELDTLLQPRSSLPQRLQDQGRVKFGTRCPQVSGGALVCW